MKLQTFTSSEVEGLCCDITALQMEKNKEVAEMAKKVMKRLREEVGRKGPQIVS